MEQMEKSGCRVGDNFVKAVVCTGPVAGGYTKGRGITVCSNYLTIQDEVNQVVIHELIHAYDECRAKNLDWTNCAHHACSEVITILDQTFDILLSKYLIGFGVCVFFNRFVQVI
jgi:inner membrane protease ATP23